MRFKQRYLVVEVHSVADGLAPLAPLACDAPSSAAAVHIRASLSVLCGSIAASSAAPSLAVKYCNLATGTAVVRVAREHARAVWAAMTVLSVHPAARPSGGDGALPCVWSVRHVAGTLRSAQRQAAGLAVRRLAGTMGSAAPAERARMQAVLDACHAEIRAMDA